VWEPPSIAASSGPCAPWNHHRMRALSVTRNAAAPGCAPHRACRERIPRTVRYHAHPADRFTTHDDTAYDSRQPSENPAQLWSYIDCAVGMARAGRAPHRGNCDTQRMRCVPPCLPTHGGELSPVGDDSCGPCSVHAPRPHPDVLPTWLAATWVKRGGPRGGRNSGTWASFRGPPQNL
jgi:hypothetical protein